MYKIYRYTWSFGYNNDLLKAKSDIINNDFEFYENIDRINANDGLPWEVS